MLSGAPVLQWGENGVFEQRFVSFFPSARIAEFCTGMLAASLWLERRTLAQRAGTAAWTAIELLACGATALALMYLGRLPGWIGVPDGSFALWLSQISCAPVFAILIPVMAYGKGLVSRALSSRLPVLLGEISFALYLVHYPIAELLFPYPAFRAFGSIEAQMVLYWALSLLAAWGLWNLIEKPGRELILALYDARRRAKSAVPA